MVEFVSPLEWRHLEARVAMDAKRYACSDLSRAFVHTCAHLLAGVPGSELPDTVTDGGGDRGIDAVFVALGSDSAIAHVFSCKHHDSYDVAKRKMFARNEIPKLKAFIDDVLDNKPIPERYCSPAIREKILQLRELLQRGVLIRFRLYICTNGLFPDRHEVEKLKADLAPLRRIDVMEVDAAHLARILVRRHEPGQPVKIQARGKLPVEKADGGTIRGIIFSLSGEEVVKLIRDPMYPQRVNPLIFDDNLRLFLGIEPDFNDIIYQTAVQDDNFKFWYLNNGLTIVCRSYEYQDGLVDPPITIHDPQIVNGCQTSNVLFDAYRAAPDKVRDLQVLVRLYATESESLRHEIAVATNTQSRIQRRDLRSNDVIQKRIEAILETRGYYYERKEDAHITQPSDKRIDALTLGQVLLAYKHEEPHRARTASDRLFGEYYVDIFNDSFSIDEALDAYELYRFVETQSLNALEAARISAARGSKRTLAYASFHLLFLVKVLMRQLGEDALPISRQQVLDDAVGIVFRLFARYPQRSNYELFRSTTTKDDLLALTNERQLNLFGSPTD